MRWRHQAAARACALAAGVFALSACATPATYGPLGADSQPFGYRDHPNADGSHTILIVADSAPSAHAFWDQRAQEICGDTAYQKNIFRAQRPVVSTTGYAVNPYGGGGSYQQDVYGSFVLEGYLRCEAVVVPPTASESMPEPTPGQNSTPEPNPTP